jgi:coatomer subunit beta'
MQFQIQCCFNTLFAFFTVRAAKFITRKKWLITGSDDNKINVFNYKTYEKIKSFEAHQDFIRCIAVHPNRPVVLSGSDDMVIKLCYNNIAITLL